MATVNAAAALSAGFRLAAAGSFTQRGAAPLAAAFTLGVGGTATALAAAPRLTAQARVIKNARAALAASPVLTASAFVPTLSADPQLTAGALVTAQAAAALHALPVLTASVSAVSVHLAADPVLLVPGQSAGAVLAAGSQLTASASTARAGAAALAASPVLQAGALVSHFAVIPLAAAPALGAVPLLTVRVSAHLAAVPVLTAATSQSAVHLAAIPVLTAPAIALRAARAALAASAHLAGAASVTGRAAAALTAHALLTADGFRSQRASAGLSAQPRLTVTGGRVIPAAAHLSAAAAVQAAARRTAVTAAHLSASPVLQAIPLVHPAAHLAASPHLAAAAGVSRAARASLRAAMTLRATATGDALARAPLSAAAALSAVPLNTVVTQAVMAASASMTTVAETRITPWSAPPPREQPAWQRDVQHFTIEQERQRHAQALWQYGELVMFCLLWRPEDLAAGIAQRCTRCFEPGRVIPLSPAQPDYGTGPEAAIAAAYGQGNQYRCTLCFGTQIIAAATVQVPGVRALIIRPAILTDTEQNLQRSRKGVVNPGTVSIQATPDFRAHTLDYMFRSDGRRYQLAVPGRVTLRTGFATPWQQTAAIAYNLMNASLEDPRASVAYVIPPPGELLAVALGTYTRVPVSYAWIEQLNGPLIPQESPPPAASGSYQPPASLPPGS